jgi:hypothetical protein
MMIARNLPPAIASLGILRKIMGWRVLARWGITRSVDPVD